MAAGAVGLALRGMRCARAGAGDPAGHTRPYFDLEEALGDVDRAVLVEVDEQAFPSGFELDCGDNRAGSAADVVVLVGVVGSEGTVLLSGDDLVAGLEGLAPVVRVGPCSVPSAARRERNADGERSGPVDNEKRG